MFEKAYVDYLLEFHGTRDYFECHEILEEHWKLDSKENRKRHWVALIQVAVGMYHYRQGNFNGAQNLLVRALEKIKLETEALVNLSLVVDDLIALMESCIQNVKDGIPYQSINLPMRSDLMEECLIYCEKLGLVFGKPSDLADDFLVNKHRLRQK